MLYKNSFSNRVYNNSIDDYFLSFNLEVSLTDNQFRFLYNIPKTIFVIDSGWLSPFYEKEPKYNQFDKMYNNFKNIIMRFTYNE